MAKLPQHLTQFFPPRLLQGYATSARGLHRSQLHSVVLPSATSSSSSHLGVQVVISEVQAVNSGTITNSLGNSPSWVELSNPTSSAVNLQVCAVFVLLTETIQPLICIPSLAFADILVCNMP